MEQNYELTPLRYFTQLTKLFFRSIFTYYFERDDEKLEKLYYETMDIQEKYIEKYCDDEDKAEIIKGKIDDLLDLVSLREQEDTLIMKYNPDTKYRGLKLRENIINDMYIELWLMGKELFLYIFERRGKGEDVIPFCIEDPYLLRIDQVYQALKNKRKPGLLHLLHKSRT